MAVILKHNEYFAKQAVSKDFHMTICVNLYFNGSKRLKLIKQHNILKFNNGN